MCQPNEQITVLDSVLTEVDDEQGIKRNIIALSLEATGPNG